MGLFESKAEKEARLIAAQQQKERQKELFNKSEILKFIIDQFQDNSNEWLKSRQNYYDCGERIVYIFPDQFSIDWRESKMVEVQTDQGLRSQWDQDTVKSLDFSYTSFGFIPVMDNALNTWTQVIQEKIKSVLPNCNVDTIKVAQGRTVRNEKCSGYMFTYTLPKINYKNWY